MLHHTHLFRVIRHNNIMEQLLLHSTQQHLFIIRLLQGLSQTNGVGMHHSSYWAVQQTNGVGMHQFFCFGGLMFHLFN